MLWHISEIVIARALCHCVQHPWKFTGRDFWCSRKKRKTQSHQKYVLRKCCGVSQKLWVLEHFAFRSTPLKRRDYWSSENERKQLSNQKCVLTKCCWVFKKWCMLELSKPCHCVQYPWKLTSRDFWSSGNDRKPLSQQKCVLTKCSRVYKKLWMLEHFAIVFSTFENLLVGISGALGTKESHFLSKICVLRKCCGESQIWWVIELSMLCHCVHHPWKLTGRDFWSFRKKGKPLFKLEHFFRKCSTVSQKLCMLELSNLCHSAQHPGNLTVRDFWRSQNKRKPLSKQKCVLRQCCGVFQKL